MSVLEKSEIALTYRNVLPRLWYLLFICDTFYKPAINQYLPYGGVTADNLKLYISKVRDNVPDDAAQYLKKDRCSYCKKLHVMTAKGDHIVNKKIHTKYPELDNNLFRINCCKSCNSSKLNKDLIDWWINHKERNIVELSDKDKKFKGSKILGVYAKAMWKYLEGENKLDDTVPEYYLKAIEQLHQHIEQSSYEQIWKIR